jgi:hypothetical protein
MKAAWYEEQGSAREVLMVGEMPDPIPAAGEVRIRITASGVNPGDIKKRAKWFAKASVGVRNQIGHNHHRDGYTDVPRLTSLTRPRFQNRLYTVGTVPPSITYSLPVIDEARSEARKATNSATSSGRFGLPSGMPPRESMMRCLASCSLIPVR